MEIQETTKDKGNALEKNVEFIFQSAGFETQRNVRIAKYEIDVLAKIGDRKIIIECKNYQNSNLTIRNLIHQWNSKNSLIKANKVILVIAGVKIKEEDNKLASKLNIELWNDDTLNELFNLSLKPSQLKKKLLEEIDFKPISISELYRDVISEFVIYPKISNIHYDDETLFNFFNNWLRIFVRTGLQLDGTTRDERFKHIELFEGTKEKKGFFNLLKFKRKEKEYWDKVREKLENEIILDKKTQNKYIGIMDDLLNEYNIQLEYFNENDGEDLIKKLISNRLYLALLRNQNPIFGFNTNSKVEVIPIDEGKFILKVFNLNDKQANLINWILTSEYETILNEGILEHTWQCFSFEETINKVYRILDEFYGFEENENLIDYSL